jgi:lipid-A-disaccharide synthase
MKLAVVAGEASGDLHAAKVVSELRRLDPSLVTFGIGGDRLAAEGMTLLHHAREMAIVGLFNVLRHLQFFRSVFDDLMQRIESERPDAVLLVDYPEFNLRVAERCRKIGIKVIYYISPQVWAWRRGRVKKIARLVDLMLVILPFEEEFYKGHDVPVVYVGHPLIDELQGTRASLSHSDEGPQAAQQALRIALMPGSRDHEVESLLPPMLDAVAALRRERDVDAFVIQAPTISADELLDIMKRCDVYTRVVPYDGGASLAAADVALSSSGTATLESAIVGTPAVVMYRLSRLTFMLAKWLVHLQHFSLINIIAGEEVVPELVQHDVNGERIAKTVKSLLEPEAHRRVLEALARVRAKLGAPGASRRAAEEVFRMLTP